MSYKVTKYPDGQISIRTECLVNFLKEDVRSYEDLFRLKSISDVYKHNRIQPPGVFIPCLFGQQSDRRFKNNESFDLKNICDFINSCNFEHLEVFHAHSDSVSNLLNNCWIRPPDQYIENIIRFRLPDTKLTLVSPDAGAYKWVFKLAEKHNLPLVAANKFRDREGNINLNFSGEVSGDCLILDDMSIGAKTHIELAKKLKENGANKVYLYVSHGFFVKGLDEVKKYIDRVFTTDSVCVLSPDDYLTVYCL